MKRNVRMMDTGYQMVDAWLVFGRDLAKVMVRLITPCNHMIDEWEVITDIPSGEAVLTAEKNTNRSDGRQARHPVDA